MSAHIPSPGFRFCQHVVSINSQMLLIPSCAGNDDGLVLGVASKKPQSMDDILMGCDVKASV